MQAVQRLLVLTMLFPGAALASEEAPPQAPQLAHQTLAIIDVIAAQHIDAPPKQELVRQIVSAIRRDAGMGPPLGLGPKLSRVIQDAEFLEILEDQWQQVLQATADTNRQFAGGKDATAEAQPSGEAILVGALTSLLRLAPGHNRLTDAREQRVQEQLAANRYVGIGITLGGAADKLPRMLRVFPNGPAAQAGAQDGDQILEIDGVSTDAVPLAEIVQRIRGPADTQVELLLQQGKDEPRRYTMTRGVVPIQRTHASRYQRKGKSIEVIEFDQLTSATVHDLRKISSEWETPPDAVLLNLQLGEHDLHRATILADALLDGGPIGRLQTVDGERTFSASRGTLFGEVPLFVLVSQNTSGAVEWLVAALQDQGRATVLGQQSAGQPYISEPFDVPGTDWVLTLSTGILQRSDGRTLLRTSQPGAPSVVPLMRQTSSPRRPSAGSRQLHDGGVIPVHLVEHLDPRSLRQHQPGQPFRGMVPVKSALETILPQITNDSQAEEAS